MGNKLARAFGECFSCCKKADGSETIDNYFGIKHHEETNAEITNEATVKGDDAFQTNVLSTEIVIEDLDNLEHNGNANDSIESRDETPKQDVTKSADIDKESSLNTDDTELAAEKPGDKLNANGTDDAMKKEEVVFQPWLAARLPRKSANNWGIINTWSRHMAEDGEDNIPINEVFRPTVKSEDLYIPRVVNIDIARPNYGRGVMAELHYREQRTGRPYNYNIGMVRSTLDTRDRRVRPRAARGVRTRVYKDRME